MRRLLAALLAAAAILVTMISVAPVAASTPAASTPARPSTIRQPKWILAKDGTRLEPAAHGGIHGLKHRVATPNGVTGATHWVILRCSYQSDWSGDPNDTYNDPVQYDTAYFQTLFSSATPGLANYWQSTSYGKISLTSSIPGATDATVWSSHQMPHPDSYYGTYDAVNHRINIPDTEFDTLFQDCASVWNSSITFDANTYYGITLDQTVGACGVGGGWTVNMDGVQSVNGTLIGNCQGDEALWSHEMGHAFGLQHSAGPDGQWYDTSYDIMSAPSGDCPAAGSWWLGNGGDVRTERTIDYGCIPGQPLAYHKAKVLGWIPAARQYKNQGGTHTITLERLADPTTNAGYLYAELPTSGGYYTVEARIKTGLSSPGLVTGYDENFTTKQAYVKGTDVTGNYCIVINKITGTQNTGVTITLQGTGSVWYGDAGQCWTDGETWTDGHGASVKVNSHTLHSITVAVTSKKQGGGAYHVLTRSRILDTATTTGNHHAPLGAGASIALQVLGKGGVPASGVTAVALFVRSTSATAASTLTVYPDGTTRPGTTSLEITKGRINSNLVTVQPGADGKIRLWNQGGKVNLQADVIGYYGSFKGGLLYNPVYPQGAFEVGGGPTASIPAHSSAEFGIAGHDTVPVTGPVAVAIQVSVIAGSMAGSVTSYPTGGARPTIPDYQFKGGDYHTGASITKLGTGGDVSIYNGSSSTISVEVETTGWYGNDGLSLRTITPARVSNGVMASGALAVKDLTGVGGVPASGPKAVLTNISVDPVDPFSYIEVRPAGPQTPYGGHDLTFNAANDSNAVIATLGSDGKVQISNDYNKTTVKIDVLGWFGAP